MTAYQRECMCVAAWKPDSYSRMSQIHMQHTPTIDAAFPYNKFVQTSEENAIYAEKNICHRRSSAFSTPACHPITSSDLQ